MKKQYSEETIQKEADQIFININQLLDSKGWDKGEKIEQHTVFRMDVGNRVAIKGEVIINKPFEKVVEFFSDPTYPKKLNDRMKNFNILQKNEGKWIVAHAQMEGFAVVSARELVNVGANKIEGNKATFGARSLQGYPLAENSDFVRAHAIVVGFVVEKIGENQTKVTNISDIDMKGSIPGFIQNQMAHKRTQALSKIEKMI